MVFAGVYPVEADQYEDLRASLEKLQLNDASLTFEPESSLALGFDSAADSSVAAHGDHPGAAVPRIRHGCHHDRAQRVVPHHHDAGRRGGGAQPSGLPEVTKIAKIEEPLHPGADHHQVGVPGQRHQAVHRQARRDEKPDLHHAGPRGGQFRHAAVGDRLRFLRQTQKHLEGYASFDYHRTGFQLSKLVKLDILLNGEPVDAPLVADLYGPRPTISDARCEKLKELIPPASSSTSPYRRPSAPRSSPANGQGRAQGRDGECYGGDISRKRKLLEKQKKGEAHAPDRQRRSSPVGFPRRVKNGLSVMKRPSSTSSKPPSKKYGAKTFQLEKSASEIGPRPMPKPKSRRARSRCGPRFGGGFARATRSPSWPKAATRGSSPNWDCSTPGRSACRCR